MYTTYIFRYSTNYNLGLVVINATSLEEAKELAQNANAWDTDDVTIIDNSIHGIILSNGDSWNF